MILAFAHPAIVVPDLEAAREFYTRMFGMRVLGKEGWRDEPGIDEAIGCRGSASIGYTLAGHNCFLELFQFEQPEQQGPEPATLNAHEPGIRHIAFYVDDCHRESERLSALGGEVLGTPVTYENGTSAVYCRDPFGNIIELTEITSPEENPINLPGVSQLNEVDTQQE